MKHSYIFNCKNKKERWRMNNRTIGMFLVICFTLLMGNESFYAQDRQYPLVQLEDFYVPGGPMKAPGTTTQAPSLNEMLTLGFSFVSDTAPIKACAGEDILVPIHIQGTYRTQHYGGAGGTAAFLINLKISDTSVIEPITAVNTGMSRVVLDLKDVHPKLINGGMVPMVYYVIDTNGVGAGGQASFRLNVMWLGAAGNINFDEDRDNGQGPVLFKVRFKYKKRAPAFLTPFPYKGGGNGSFITPQGKVLTTYLINTTYYRDSALKHVFVPPAKNLCDTVKIVPRDLPILTLAPSLKSDTVCLNVFKTVSADSMTFTRMQNGTSTPQPRISFLWKSLPGAPVPNPGSCWTDTTSQNPIFKGTMPGQYSYLFSVSDDHGCVSSDTVKVDVLSPQLRLKMPEDTFVLFSKPPVLNASLNTINGSESIEKYAPIHVEWLQYPSDTVRGIHPATAYTRPELDALLNVPAPEAYTSTAYIVNLSDKMGCTYSGRMGVNIDGEIMKGKITPFPIVICGNQEQKDTVTLYATLEGAGPDVSYHWTATSIVSGTTQPTISDPSAKAPLLTYYGVTAVCVNVSSNRGELTICDTMEMRDYIQLKAHVLKDSAMINKCAYQQLTFHARFENGGPNPKIQWRINNNYVLGATDTVFTTNAMVENDSVSFEIISDEKCVSTPMILSEVFNPNVERYQFPSIYAFGIESGFDKCNNVAPLYSMAILDPGSQPIVSVYRNDKLDAEYHPSLNAFTKREYATGKVEYGYKVNIPTQNYYDRIHVSIKNTTSHCLEYEDARSQDYTPRQLPVAGSALLAGTVHSDLGGDTVCSSAATTFYLSGMKNLGKNAIVIWVYNGKEIARYQFPPSNTSGSPKYYKPYPFLSGASNPKWLNTNSTDIDDEESYFKNGYPLYTIDSVWNNSDPDDPVLMWPVLKSGDSVWAIVVRDTNCNGGSVRDIAVTPKFGFNIFNPAPASVTVSGNVSTACENDSVEYTAVPVYAGGSPRILWKIGNDTVENYHGLKYKTNKLKPGEDVTVVLSSNFRCATNLQNDGTVSAVASMTIHPLPIVNAGSDTMICANTSVQLKATASGADAYSWLPAAKLSPSTALQPMASPGSDSATVFILEAKNTTTTCKKYDTVVVTTKPNLEVKVQLKRRDSVACALQSVYFDAISQNVGTNPKYFWRTLNTDGSTNLLRTTSDTVFETRALSPGVWAIDVVLVSNVNTCKSNTDTSNPQTVEIFSKFDAQIQTQTISGGGHKYPTNTGAAAVCEGSSLKLIATGTTEHPVYQWLSPNDPSVGTNQKNAELIVTPTVDSSVYKAIVSKKGVCPDTATITVIMAPNIVNPVVSIQLQNGGEPQYCAGQDHSFTFVASATGLNRTYFDYSFFNPRTQSMDAISGNEYTYDNLEDADSVYAKADVSSPACGVLSAISPAKYIVEKSVPSTTIIATQTIKAEDSVLLWVSTPVATDVVGYSWTSVPSTAQQTISSPTKDSTYVKPTATTIYRVVSTAGNGCEITDEVRVNVIDTLEIKISADADTVCGGTTVNFTSVSRTGDTYKWYVNTTLQPESGASFSYQPAHGDSVYCVLSASFDPTRENRSNVLKMVVDAPIIVQKTKDTTLCVPKNPVQFMVSGGTTYTWREDTTLSHYNISNPVARPEATTTYKFTIDKGRPCQVSDSIKITVIATTDTLSIKLQYSKDSVCKGEMVTFNAQSQYASVYEWYVNGVKKGNSSSNLIWSMTLGDSIYVVAQQNASCVMGTSVKSKTIKLKVYDLNVNAGEDQIICLGENFRLNGKSNADVSTWSPSATLSSTVILSPLATPSQNMNYILTGKSGNCTRRDTVSVQVKMQSASPSIDGASICKNEKADLFVKDIDNEQIYTWYIDTNRAAVFTGAMYTNVDPNEYFVRSALVSGKCPTDFARVVVTAKEDVVAGLDFSPNTIFTGDEVQFTAQTENAATWQWSLDNNVQSSEKDPVHTYLKAGTYSVSLLAISKDGCRDSVSRQLIVSERSGSIFMVPNAFMPDGSNPEDRVFKVFSIEAVASFSLKVYNNGGVLLFETTDPVSGWDGIYKGTPQPAGSYVFVLKATTKSGMLEERRGNLVLVR